MKKLRIAGLGMVLALVAVLVMAQSTPPTYSRVENVAYFRNPVTGGLGLYLSFELVPGHTYLFQYTRNGVDFFDGFTVNTAGNAREIYESFNIEPCSGLWPRVVDLGASQ